MGNDDESCKGHKNCHNPKIGLNEQDFKTDKILCFARDKDVGVEQSTDPYFIHDIQEFHDTCF
jgi:hypothetical protein